MAGYYDRDRRTRNLIGTDSFDTTHPVGTMNHPTTHIGNTSEYMASGYPFVHTMAVKSSTYDDEAGNPQATTDGDVLKVSFPFVTRWIMVRGTDNDGDANVAIGKIYMGFSETGVKTSTTCFDVSFLDNTRLELKCSELFFKCSTVADCTNIQIIAGLTNIPAGDFVVTTSAETNIGVESTATVIQVHGA